MTDPRLSAGSKYGLLPCPFCGAAARTDLLPHVAGPGWVQCSECECDQFMSDTLDEAVAKWNRRAVIATDAQSVGMREAAIHDCIEVVQRYNDCGANYIEEKLRDLLDASQLSPAATVETVAEEILRADAEPPEASFDNVEDMMAYLNSPARSSAVKATAPWVCCNCDAPLSCAVCGVEQPNDSEHYRKLQEENDRLRAVPQTVVWQLIETAPKDKPIMLCVEGFLPSVGRWWPIDSCWASFDWEGHFESDKEMSDYVNGSSYEPTHWAPLPSGPSMTRPQHSTGETK